MLLWSVRSVVTLVKTDTCGCGPTVGLLPSKQSGAGSTPVVRSNCQCRLAMHLATAIQGLVPKQVLACVIGISDVPNASNVERQVRLLCDAL